MRVGRRGTSTRSTRPMQATWRLRVALVVVRKVAERSSDITINSPLPSRRCCSRIRERRAERHMTRVVLVRHAEGKVNIDGVIGGLSGCTGLTELGGAQAELLRERWTRTGFRP